MVAFFSFYFQNSGNVRNLVSFLRGTWELLSFCSELLGCKISGKQTRRFGADPQVDAGIERSPFSSSKIKVLSFALVLQQSS